MAEINFDLDELEAEEAAGACDDKLLKERTSAKPSLNPREWSNECKREEKLEPEKEKQFNIGMLPISIIQKIDEASFDARTNRKTFLLKALKNVGVDIPEELLRDRRRAE